VRPKVVIPIALAVLVAAALVAPATARIRKPRWVGHVAITEYYPVPEKWFVGAKVDAPGLPGQHRIDWLYSARGVSMEGDGVDLDGNEVHIDDLGDGGWVNVRGQTTDTDGAGGWSRGAPFWRAGAYWRSADRYLTFPLDQGGWFHGEGVRYYDPPGATFAPGPSRPLAPYKSIAVDPDLIALGSKIYVPEYRDHGGWFTAADTGSAIQGRHVDVFRTPPASIDDSGQYFTNARIYVVPPGRRAPRGAPPGADVVQPSAPAGGGGSTPQPGPDATGGTAPGA
jgi:3D (Asp-Asp-Asp) domain-containing protein